MEAIPWAAMDAQAPSGMLILAVRLILTGRTVRKSTYAVMATARDDWQATAEKKQENIHTLAKAIRDQARSV